MGIRGKDIKMAYHKKKNKIKKHSYRDRRDFHTDRMREGFGHGGKLNKKESYSAGFVHWDSSLSTFNSVRSKADASSFDKGCDAGLKAYNKAMNYKF